MEYFRMECRKCGKRGQSVADNGVIRSGKKERCPDCKGTVDWFKISKEDFIGTEKHKS